MMSSGMFAIFITVCFFATLALGCKVIATHARRAGKGSAILAAVLMGVIMAFIYSLAVYLAIMMRYAEQQGR